MAELSPARQPGTVEIDAHDWDVILLGQSPRILCEGPTEKFSPRMSSRIVYVDGVLVSSPDQLKLAGEGTHLTTTSGNTYVLRGRRKTWGNFEYLSIFFDSALLESWSRRCVRWIFGRKPRGGVAPIARP